MTTEKLTLVVSLETNDEQVADVHQVDDGRWMVTTTYPIPRADLTRMLMAAGALVPTLPAADDAATHARMADLERWHNEDMASLCALQKEVETLNAQCAALKLNEEVMRQQARVNAERATELRTALDMERAGAASLLREMGATPPETLRDAVVRLIGDRDALRARAELADLQMNEELAGRERLRVEAGAQPGETLREVVLRLKRRRDEAKQACDVATAQNERLRSEVEAWKRANDVTCEERDDARQEAETLRRNLADAQSDNANNADEVMRLKAEVACRAGEMLKLSDALNEEHDKRLDAEVTIARFQSRCTLTLFTILSGMQRDNPLEGNVLDWEWENGVGRVVLCRRK